MSKRENLKRDITYLLDKLSDHSLDTLLWFTRRLWANEKPANYATVGEH